MCCIYLIERKAGKEDSEVSERATNRRLTNLHAKEHHNLYSLPNIVWVIRMKRRMMQAGHMAVMVKNKMCIGFWWGNLKEWYLWEDWHRRADDVKIYCT